MVYSDVPGSGENKTDKKLQRNESKIHNNDCWLEYRSN